MEIIKQNSFIENHWFYLANSTAQLKLKEGGHVTISTINYYEVKINNINLS